VNSPGSVSVFLKYHQASAVQKEQHQKPDSRFRGNDERAGNVSEKAA